MTGLQGITDSNSRRSRLYDELKYGSVLTWSLSARSNPWEWRLMDLQRLIRDSVPEDAYLEYKAGAALSRTESGKHELSKDVSAFANAGGGTLIYGITERDHRPLALDGIQEDDLSREWLEQIIVSRIRPRVEGIRIRVVRTKAERVVYVVWIPQSDRGPHQVADKRFYSRRNFTVQAMEEYEIRDVYQRRRSPDVVLDFFFRRLGARVDSFPISWGDPITLHHLELNAELRNEGGGAVGEALVTLTLDARLLADQASLPLPFRDLSLSVQGRQVAVKHVQIPWRGPRGLSLFKSVAYRLLDTDQPISFRQDWVEADPPFVLWDVRAPDMMPRTGCLKLRRTGDAVSLAPSDISEIEGLTQHNRQRPFLGRPDLSVGPFVPDG